MEKKEEKSPATKVNKEYVHQKQEEMRHRAIKLRELELQLHKMPWPIWPSDKNFDSQKEKENAKKANMLYSERSKNVGVYYLENIIFQKQCLYTANPLVIVDEETKKFQSTSTNLNSIMDHINKTYPLPDLGAPWHNPHLSNDEVLNMYEKSINSIKLRKMYRNESNHSM